MRLGRRRERPAPRPLPGQRVEYETGLCGARPVGDDAPPAGLVNGCHLPANHGGHRHLADAEVDGRTVSDGYTWPRRRR